MYALSYNFISQTNPAKNEFPEKTFTFRPQIQKTNEANDEKLQQHNSSVSRKPDEGRDTREQSGLAHPTLVALFSRCQVALIADEELFPTRSFLPKNFWTSPGFSGVILPQELVDSVDKW